MSADLLERMKKLIETQVSDNLRYIQDADAAMAEAAETLSRLTAELEAVKRERDAAQFWLAELDQYGNPKLVDGSHERREGVEQASYLFARLGLGKGKSYACAEVILTSVEAKPHGSNEDALDTLNSIGLRP